MISARGLEVVLAGRRVLGPCEVALEAGEVLGICGPNGAGKSTLLKALAGVLPIRGSITLDGVSAMNMTASQRAQRVAWLPQTRTLGWPLTVRELVALGRQAWPRDETLDTHLVSDALSTLGLESMAERLVESLSGGEQARAHVARMLAATPSVLLADEPVAALDQAQQLRTLALFRELARKRCAVAVVLHDLALAARSCDRIIVLKAGSVVSAGSPPQALDSATLADVFGIQRSEAHGLHSGFELLD